MVVSVEEYMQCMKYQPKEGPSEKAWWALKDE